MAFAEEDVAEVAVADGAADFGAGVAEVVVGIGFDVFGFGGIVEGGPAAAGVEFFFGGKELGIASGAVVGAGALFFELFIDVTVGAFGAGFAEDAVLLGGELFFPFFVGFFHGLGRLFGCFFFGGHGGFFVVGVQGGGDEGEACEGGEDEGEFHFSGTSYQLSVGSWQLALIFLELFVGVGFWFFIPGDVFGDVPGGDPLVLGLGVALFEEPFFEVWVVGGSVEDADFFVSFGDLFVEDFEAFDVAWFKDDGAAEDVGGVVGAEEDGVFFFDRVGLVGEEGEEDAGGAGLAFGRLDELLEGGFERGFEHGTEEGAFFFLEGGPFLGGGVGVDEIFSGVIDDFTLIDEVELPGDGGVGFAEEGGVLECGAFLGREGFPFLEFLVHVFAADHLEEEDLVVGEDFVELLVVGFVADVDGADEVHGEVAFLVGGDGGLELGGGFGFVDAGEGGALFFFFGQVFGRGECGEKDEEGGGELGVFHFSVKQGSACGG